MAEWIYIWKMQLNLIEKAFKYEKTQDITELLANRINHPTKEMHQLFADSLFEIIFPEKKNSNKENSSTMYKE